MLKKLSYFVSGIILSLNLTFADHEGYEYARTFLDLNDTLSGIVEGDVGRWQNSPHGVVVAPDGNIWVGLYAGSGRQEVFYNDDGTPRDTVHYKGIYVLDPVTMDHVSYSPIEILTFPDGTSDSLTAESATSGGSRGIALDSDGHILSSHYKTLYKINYMTGEGVAMFVGEGALTEAAADDNGNIYLSYVLAAELPVLTLDNNLNFVGNAVEIVGRINRSIVVTGNGENMLLGSTWDGMGFSHLTSTVPGVIEHTPVDTFGVYYDVEADWHHIGSAMGSDSAYVHWGDYDYFYADTTYDTTSLWVSALDLSPDESTLLVGTLTAGWGGPLGGTNWVFDMDDLTAPVGQVGNWHGRSGFNQGVTDGPRGVAFDAQGNLYLADFYTNAVHYYSYSEALTISDDNQKNIIADQYILSQNYPNPFNPNTRIEFKIPMMEQVNISVYNLEGRIVKTLVNQVMNAGSHEISWNGTNEIGAKVSTGMYIYQLKTNSTMLTRRMTFIK